MSFETRASAYGRRHCFWEALAVGIKWIPSGCVFAFAAAAADIFYRPLPRTAFFLAAVLPPLAAMVLSYFRYGGTYQALSWLDDKTKGKQELQAALEQRDGGSVLSSAILHRGDTILRNSDHMHPRPTSMSLLAALFSLGLLLGGLALLNAYDPGLDGDTIADGRALEEWAEAWAEEGAEGGDREDRALAGRMEALGRKLSDGALGEKEAERALKELEEDIMERRNDLLRDKIAESLVDDLGVDREAAEAFRVGKKRLPADVLSELGDAFGRSPLLSESERETLEELLSDPDYRNSDGSAKESLEDELSRVLEEALDPNDPHLDRLDRAAQESRKVREPEARGEDREGRGELTLDEEDKNPESGPSSGGRGTGTGDEDADSTGRSGGSGRGSAPVKDSDEGTLAEVPPSTDKPLRLPSESGGSKSWRTVIRAYGESGDTGLTSDSLILPSWEKDVESVISREDIPPGLKDFVKDYFLALEAGTEIMAAESGVDSEADLLNGPENAAPVE